MLFRILRGCSGKMEDMNVISILSNSRRDWREVDHTPLANLGRPHTQYGKAQCLPQTRCIIIVFKQKCNL